jgi:hypothetical protein
MERAKASAHVDTVELIRGPRTVRVVADLAGGHCT